MFLDDAVNQRLCIANLRACMNLFCDYKFKEVFFNITGYATKIWHCERKTRKYVSL